MLRTSRYGFYRPFCHDRRSLLLVGDIASGTVKLPWKQRTRHESDYPISLVHGEDNRSGPVPSHKSNLTCAFPIKKARASAVADARALLPTEGGNRQRGDAYAASSPPFSSSF